MKTGEKHYVRWQEDNGMSVAPISVFKISSPWNSGPGLTGGGAPPPQAPLSDAGSDDSNSKDGPSSGGGRGANDVSNSDAEGVWSPDIEQSFQEALAIYPPCGRRKIILSDEGKMYGRNELIARYIKLRTGKTRTRKQVSSHIQVLARRKAREIQSKLKDTAAKEKALQSLTSLSSAQIVSATAMQNKAGLASLVPPVSYTGAPFWQPPIGQPGTSEDVKPFASQPYALQSPKVPPVSAGAGVDLLPPPHGGMTPSWEGRSIATHKLRLVEFSAFMELQQDTDTCNKHLFVHIGGPPTYTDPLLEAVDIRQIYDKFPEKKGGLKELYDKGPQDAFFLVKFWADLNTSIQDEAGVFYGVTSQYESNDNMTITCSTKVCSFGKQVVEKVETEYARFENGRFVYRIHRSPMCEYMINFIHKLKHLPEKYMMNSVLENFTILQVVTNRDTQETLLCIAYVFEVSTSVHGAQHHIYRLVKD
ncbi:transcriptional enhancer factor TEF-1 isoform X2 [Dermacentor silvarum]|uniref:transcriptional enhancer factor TEF-1 isoform X2 n=1 Tax=Dermacentor silvarum TaxID=543639 RepID=UPI0021015C67|nr:transcriptional enhancer factor TEF-1 isoform X2 [Dermacentor silvarum]XP_049512544.1 transcriptional enhancer factor TEF-1 isoform X2 [Dermacentor silvarum]